jgi:SagB-type dehydrogenase family enzyme
VFVLNVSGLDVGLYRYLPLEHELLLVRREEGLRGRLASAALRQSFVGASAATFVWTAMPYRMEWRYDLAAHKVIAIDVGHVCQNLYLACAAIGAGCCAVGAYHQDLMDQLLGVDGQDEFAIYLAPVGKVWRFPPAHSARRRKDANLACGRLWCFVDLARP